MQSNLTCHLFPAGLKVHLLFLVLAGLKAPFLFLAGLKLTGAVHGLRLINVNVRELTKSS